MRAGLFRDSVPIASRRPSASASLIRPFAKAVVAGLLAVGLLAVLTIVAPADHAAAMGCTSTATVTDGTIDNYVGPEPTTPSQDLRDLVNNPSEIGFDTYNNDNYFLHTMDLSVPAGQVICGAILTMQMDTQHNNDTISFRVVDSPTTYVDNVVFNVSISDLGVTFTSGPTLVTLDLANLPATSNPLNPTTLIPQIAPNGWLDIALQDDTAVDYISVELFTEPAGPTCDSGLNVLFVIDNSASIDGLEYASFINASNSVGNQLLALGSTTGNVEIASAHYAGPVGELVHIERDFSSAPVALSTAKFLGGNDDLALALRTLNDALTGVVNPAVVPASAVTTFTYNPAYRTHVVMFTDAAWDLPGNSSILDFTGSYDYEIYDSMKANLGASLTMVHVDSAGYAAHASATTSAGGQYTGAVTANPSDPFAGVTPRRYWPTAFDFTGIANDIASDITTDCALDLQKTTNGVADAGIVPVGSVVTWDYTVSNTSGDPMTNVTITDDQEGPVCIIALLAPGTSQTCTLTGTAQAGPYTNTATVTADLLGFLASDVTSSSYTGASDAECFGEVVTIDMNIAGTSGTGTTGPDVILGTPGDDTIDGLGGDDLICGGDGDDTIDGGQGDDRIYGSFGNDLIRGEAGNDELLGREGHDDLYGGDGDDVIHGFDGNDLVYGGRGDDDIEGNDGVDRLFGQDGLDEIIGGDGADRLYGGGGVDFIWGDAGADRIYGQAGDDILHGGDGDDLMYGGADFDQISGGSGEDRIYGQAGDDTINGDDDNDTLYGNIGVDTVYGDAGDDTIYGQAGVDSLHGGLGNDTVYGGGDGDTLEGNDGDDLLYGQAGDDDLFGNAGTDGCFGGAGTDYIDASC